jgi:hypothetical protein
LNSFYIHTYYLRYIPEGVAEASQIFIRDAHVLPKLLSYEEYWRLDKVVISPSPTSIISSTQNSIGFIKYFDPCRAWIDCIETFFAKSLSAVENRKKLWKISKKRFLVSIKVKKVKVRSTARLVLHLQFDISANAPYNNSGTKSKVYSLMCCSLYLPLVPKNPVCINELQILHCFKQNYHFNITPNYTN